MSTSPPRRRLVGVSLKMYFSLSQTRSYLSALTALSLPSTIDIFVIPSFLSLALAPALLAPAPVPILTGAQDCYWEDRGAYTGEVSPLEIREAGCTFVELGHAERRRGFGETDETVQRKAAAAARNGLVPLVCIGEQSKDGGVPAAVAECREQILSLLSALPSASPLVLAYEPVWAIGQPKPAPSAYVIAVTKQLREIVEQSGREGEVRIIYGGSAQPGLWEELKEGVDGLFLGRFAHDVKAFERVLQEVAGYRGS